MTKSERKLAHRQKQALKRAKGLPTPQAQAGFEADYCASQLASVNLGDATTRLLRSNDKRRMGAAIGTETYSVVVAKRKSIFHPLGKGNNAIYHVGPR